MNSTLASDFALCPEALIDDQTAQYWRDGYIAFTDVFTLQEVEDARAALSELAHNVVENEGREQKGTFWTLPGARFGIQFEAGYTPQATDADLELRVRKLMIYRLLASDYSSRSAEFGSQSIAPT